MAAPFTAQDTDPCAIYARISKDRTGEERGVGRQIEDCRELIARHPEWHLDDRAWDRGGRIYTDNDISAVSGKRRPAYEALMDALGRGEIRVVVIYMQSRLWRTRRERAEGLEQFKAARGRLEIVKGQSVDMTKAMDRGMVALLGEFDTLEGEIKGERQQAAIIENAELGAYHGPRSFGFQVAYITDAEGRRIRSLVPDEDEAGHVREAVRRVLDGDSVRSICLDWDARGIKTVGGGRWSGQSLKQTLTALRNAGVREHAPGSRGGRRTAANCYPASWPAIVEPADIDAVREILFDPGRRTAHDNARVHLLSGFLRCGQCGGRMKGAPLGGRERYACPAKPEGCGGICRAAPGVETAVLRRVFHWLEDNGLFDQARAAVEDNEVRDLRERRRTLRRRREQCDDYLADETWDKPAYVRQCRRVEADIAAIDRELSRHVGARVLDGVPERGDELVRQWRAWERDGARGFDKRRDVLGVLIDRVVIHSTVSGRGRADPSRIQVFPGAWADLLADPAAAQPAPVTAIAPLGEQIRAYLDARPGESFSAAQIAKAIGCHPVWAADRIKRLIAEGAVVRVGRAEPLRGAGRITGSPPYLYTAAAAA